MDIEKQIRVHMENSIQTKRSFLEDSQLLAQTQKLLITAEQTLLQKGTIFFCGNGGSFSDALHLTAELTGRFKRDRAPMASICLGSGGSAVTAIANDIGYDYIFARELQALGKEGDLLIALSTSGNSENVLQSLQVASSNKITAFSLLGKDGGKAAKDYQNHIIVPSNDTAHIQETHIAIGHILCDWLEKRCVT